MLTLAFDTATSVATSALMRGRDVVGERVSAAVRVLADVDDLLRDAGAEAGDISRIVVGTGPGSFTGVRVGLSTARALAFALDVPLAGVSTLAALAAGMPGAVPVIDAKRREVFALLDGEARCVAPADLELPAGTECVGDGAVRYRETLEAAGARVPPDDSEAHVPRASLHAGLATTFGPPDAVQPIYLRLPDAARRRTA